MRRWYGKNQRNNRVWLKRMMKHFGLTRREVAEAVGVNISTVDRWLVPPDASSTRKMPSMARTLLTRMADDGAFDREETA